MTDAPASRIPDRPPEGRQAPDAGVLLLQMGGPENVDAVRPFIRNMLSDAAILAAPGFVRLPLAAWIAWRRAPHVRAQYRQIGGGSPIGAITARQAEGLARVLAEGGTPMPVWVAMRYTRPTVQDALAQAAGAGIRRLVLLPLYPQHSRTTTGSSLTQAVRAADRLAPALRRVVVEDWADDPAYVAAVARTVDEALDRLGPLARARSRVLFSAHGLPERYVQKGDRYPERVAATVSAVAGLLGGRMPDWGIAYQSRVGPVRWLEPDTAAEIGRAAAEGIRGLVLVPIAFVSDHLETLYEMDVTYREQALAAGVTEFVRAASMNEAPDFLAALAGIVRRALETAEDR